jgi:thermitase
MTIEDDSVGYPSPIFKGFLIQLGEATKNEIVQDVVDQIVQIFKRDVINSQSSDWKSIISGDLIEIFIKRDSEISFTSGNAWDIAYCLRNLSGVVYAEPMFATSTNSLVWTGGRISRENSSGEPSIDSKQPQVQAFQEFEEDKPPQDLDPNWSLKEIRVPAAWERFNKLGYKPGQGVIIGHPDTGYQLHPEILPSLLLEKGRDFVDGDVQPIDEQNERSNRILENNPGHGTSTASVIISPKGSQLASQGSQQNDLRPALSGVAYGAKLIPLRISPSVVFYETLEPDLARAIDYAVEQEVHVISISMGGLPSLSLRKAVINAQKKGVIVVAAAGNGFPFVVWPAAYDAVTAVASSGPSGKIADHSCKGSRVDVTAPGESVLHATFKEENGKLVPSTELGSGTSFAVALVAGLAALWLSYYGRDNLEEKYGLRRIPLVFDKLLRETCRKPENWDTARCGAGIVDAEALLNIPFDKLPDPMNPSIQVPLAFRQVDHVLLDRGGSETFAHLFEEMMDNPEFATALQEILSKILNKSGKDLRQSLRTFGQELAFHFGTNSKLFNPLKTFLEANGSDSEKKRAPLNEVLTELRRCASKYLNLQLPPQIPA